MRDGIRQNSQLAEQPAGGCVPARADRDAQGAGVAALRRGGDRRRGQHGVQVADLAAQRRLAAGLRQLRPIPRRRRRQRAAAPQSVRARRRVAERIGRLRRRLAAEAGRRRRRASAGCRRSNISLKGTGTYTYDNTSSRTTPRRSSTAGSIRGRGTSTTTWRIG